jgi:hypothetical protein
MYDRKSETKLLRFYWAGIDELEKNGITFCPDYVPGYERTDGYLFHNKRDEPKEFVETRLLLVCRPLTIGQRVADWFSMRGFHVTGTIAGQLSSKSDEYLADLAKLLDGETIHPESTIESGREMLDKLLKSWFSRSKSNDAQREGTENESVVLKALRGQSFIEGLWEVGMVEQTKLPFENSHILHLWRKILLAAWRAHQATEMHLAKNNGEWPRRYRIEKFGDLDGICGRVRLNHAPGFHHELVRSADENGFGKKCALCSNGSKKRTSVYWCQICEVHLCTTVITHNSRKSCNQQWHTTTDLKREAAFRNSQVESLQVVKRSVTKSRKRLLSSEREDTTDARMIDENDSPLAGSILEVNDENVSPLDENVLPRRVLENITLVRRSTRRATAAIHGELSPLAKNVPPRRVTRRATAALHGELTSVLEIQGGAEILTSVRNQKSSVREMEDL